MSSSEEIFTTPESEARLDLIRHLIENSELVPLVRGVSGIGKSLLASRLQESAPGSWVVCHFSADSMMQPERMLAQIARSNGLPDTSEENIRRLVDYFEAQRLRGNVPVLLIDDAQELPPTSLITLLRLYERQIEGTPLVSLVLFANEQIDTLLSTPQLQIMSPQSIQVIDLPPFTLEEATAYMRFLLKTEGIDPRLTLSPNRLARIYRETGGAPGRLSSAILAALGEGGGSDTSAGSWRNRPVVWGGLSLGVIMVLLLLFQEPVNRIFSTPAPATNPPLAVTEPSESEVPGGAETTSNVGSGSAKSPPAERPAVGSGLRIIPSAEIRQSKQVTIPVETEVVDSGKEADTSPAEGAEQLPGPPAEAEAEARSTGETSSSPPAGDRVASPAADAEIVPAEEMEPVVEVPPLVVAEEPAESVAESQPPEEPPAAPAPRVVRSQAWLSGQPPESFTIQLLAVENLASVDAAIEKLDLDGDIFTVRTEYRGRDWYPLLWGVFKDRQAASEALKGLSPELREKGAWVRPIASLRR